ncbi:hypothetical protein UFOVP784_121 [uncultured Caudovirales phage]|uniref:Uncharacterized protein n=1 Tax=uncultured Caudovirales phage TaxID=2100421 RepID=A0A6J5MC62_9CAUD|nr:hypothetical protein UFOVP436_121 [uncultured Caudovirales phage]CAB4162797.1 hypothetical protein UFOVP784_121 [uncultured Caudovirales phage]
MIAPEFLYELKSLYGSVFQTYLKKQLVIFRELTFAEFDKITEHQNSGESSAEIEDLIIKIGVIYPEDINVDAYPAGLVSSLAEEILEESGFASPRKAKRILDEKRLEASEVRSLMKAFVLATITSYTPEDLDNLTYTKLAQKVALSEKIMEIKQAILGIESTNVNLQLVDPEEVMEKEQDKANRYNQSRKEGEAKYNDPVAQKLWGAR